MARKAGLRAARKEIERPRLERLVADREVVIPAGNDERPRTGQQSDELRGIAGKRVALADRDQRRLCYARRLLGRQAPVETAHAGGERNTVALRLIGEGAEQALQSDRRGCRATAPPELPRSPPAIRRRAQAGHRDRRARASARGWVQRARGSSRCARPSNNPLRPLARRPRCASRLTASRVMRSAR